MREFTVPATVTVPRRRPRDRRGHRERREAPDAGHLQPAQGDRLAGRHRRRLPRRGAGGRQGPDRRRGQRRRPGRPDVPTRYEWTLFDFAIWSAGARRRCRSTRPLAPSRCSGSSATPARSPCVVETAAHPAVRRVRPRPAARPAARLADRGRRGRGAVAGRHGRHRRGAWTRRARRAERRRPGHDHLHLRHHRPAQGLRAHPRATCCSSAATRWTAAPVFRTGEARRCSSCRSRTSSAGWSQVGACIETGAVIGHTAGRQEPDRRPRRASGRRFVLVGAARLREGLQRAPSRRRRRAARARSSTSPAGPRSRTARRWTPAARAARAEGSSTRLFDRLVYSKLRAALGGQGAVRDLRRRAARRAGWATSSAASASRSVEGYGLTETTAAATRQPAGTGQDRHGRPAAARAWRSASPTTARSCSRGEHVFTRLLEQRGGHRGGASTPTAGSTPATSAPSTRTAT